jgi:hypothetical protein
MASGPGDCTEHLLKNVHEDMKPPTAGGTTTLIQGSYRYYHYGCDGLNDRVRPHVNVEPYN